eukprot:3199731-Amphidinium_carterae.2
MALVTSTVSGIEIGKTQRRHEAGMPARESHCSLGNLLTTFLRYRVLLQSFATAAELSSASASSSLGQTLRSCVRLVT